MKTRGNAHRWALALATVALLELCAASPAATQWEGDDTSTGTSHREWQRGENWAGGSVPGAGTDVTFNNASVEKIVDLNGTSVNVGVFYVAGGFDDATFQNSGGAASITATSLHIYQAWRQTFDADLIVTGDIYQTRKSAAHVFNGSVSAGGLDMGQGGSTFNAPVTITGAGGLEAKYKSIAIGGGVVYTFNNVLNSPGGTIWSTDPTRPSRVNLGAANTLSGLTGTLNVNAHGQLNFATPQTGGFGTGSVAVNAYGMLLGDPGSAAGTWGPGKDIDLKTDAILALTGGTAPTPAEIGIGVVWQGVTGNGTWTAGNDGVGIYKGLAVGGFSSDLKNKTLVAPAGAGDAEVLVLPGLPSNPASLNVESTDGTSVANFHVVGPVTAKGGRFNADPATGNQVTTFNMMGEAGSPGAQILNLTNDFTVYSDQTFNVKGEGKATVDPSNMKGSLTFSGDTMLLATTEQFVNKGTAGYENTKLAFGDGTALSIASNEVGVLELLDFAGQVTITGTPFLTLESRDNAVYNITAATTPNLIEFMKRSNITFVEGNNDDTRLMGEGLVIGDGKYLMSFHTKGYHKFSAEAGHPAKISGEPGAASIGIANVSTNTGRTLEFLLPIDGNGATIMVNSTAVMEYAEPSSNTRRTGIAAGNVRFSGALEDTPELAVLGGKVFLNPTSVPAGMDLTVAAGATVDVETAVQVDVLGGNGQVLNATNLDFATVAPGASIGALILNDFAINDGDTYQWQLTGAGVAGVDYDTIDGQDVTFDGLWTLELLDLSGGAFTPDGSEVFTLIDADSLVRFSDVNITIAGDFTGRVYADGGDILLTELMRKTTTGGEIPEPATMALLGLAACGLGGYVRRRRRA